MAEVDSLNIKISAEVNKANASIELLSKKLDRLSASLSGVNSKGLATLGTGVNKLANAMGNFTKNTKTSDFLRLSRSLASISNIDKSKLSDIASEMAQLSKSLSGIQNKSVNINIRKEGLENISNSAKKAESSLKTIIDASGKVLSSVSNSAKIAGASMQPLEQQAKKVSLTLEQIQEKYKDLGKGFVFKGDTRQLQKQIDSLTNQLSKAKLAKEDFETSGKTNLGGYETAVKNVIKLTNQIESLKNQFESINTIKPVAELKIHGSESASKFIIEYKKELLDLKEHVKAVSDIYGGYSNSPKGTFDTPIKQLQTSIQELKRDYPQATEVITAFEKELQRLQDISSKLTKEPTRVKVDTSSLDRVNERITELTTRFEHLGKDFKFTGNFEQLNIEIEKAASKLRELGLKEQEMLSSGKVNTEDFERLQAAIMETGNKLDIMKDLSARTEEFRNQLKQLQVPPIHEENLTKLQNALRKTEEDTEKLRIKLQNGIIMGRIVPNIDDSQFRKLTEQIALSEKQAEALRKKINEVENATKSTGKQNSIVNKLANSFKNLSNKAEKSVKPIDNMSKAFKSMARNILPILGIRELFSFGKESIENSMNYLETLNYFNKAFEQVASKADLSSFEEMGYESADAYYKSFSQRAKELTSKMTGFEISDTGKLSATGAASLGIDPTQLMNYQAMFAQMSSSMGVASETSLKLSQALTEIGADLASVRNMDFDKVWQDMASGLAGMSRTLDKYGVNIRNVNLQQKLNELGINANISALNQENKVMLRSIILLESTEYAYADLAKTINAPANQLRLLKSNFANLSRTIGNIFLPIVSKILPYINGLTIALQRLFTFIGELIGLDMDLSSLGGTGSNETADDILGDLQDNLDNASESAKELKNELLGFDEINKLSDTLDTEGAGTGIGGIDSDLLDKAFDDALSKYQETWDKAFADMENGSNIIADKIEKALEPVKKIIKDFAIGDFFSAGEDVSNLVISINEFIAKAIDDVDWKKIGKNVGKFLAGIKWIDVFKSFSHIIIEALQSSIEYYFSMLKEAPIETALITAFATWKFKGAFATLSTKFLSLAKAHPFITATTIVAGIAINWEEISNLLKTTIEELGKLLSVNIASGTTIGISTDISKFAQDMEKAAEAYEKIANTNRQNIEEITNKYEGIKKISEEYISLSQNYDNLTESQKTLVEEYSKIIAENVDGSTEYIDTLTGKWVGTSTQMEELINKTEEYYKTLARQKILTELYTEQAKAEKNAITASNKLKRKTEELVDKYTDLYDATGNIEYNKIADLIIGLYEANGNLSELDDTTRRFYESSLETKEITSIELRELQKLAEIYGIAENTLEDVNSDIKQYTENQQKAVAETSHSTIEVENFGERTGQVSQNVAGMRFPINVTTEEAHSKIDKLEEVYKEIPKEKTTDIYAKTDKAIQMVDNAVYTINRTLYNLTTPELKLKTDKAVEAATDFAKMVKNSLEKISIKPTIHGANLAFDVGLGLKTRAYAAGGFPTSGLSLVGENGPELYGSFNGRPAVAANASITEGIRQAAYEGMKMALAEYQNGETQVNVTLQGDAKKFFTAMQSEAQNYVATNHLSPFPV